MPDADSDGTPNQMPLIDFADVNRDAMVDMVFYRDGAITVLYNQYEAVSHKDAQENLC